MYKKHEKASQGFTGNMSDIRIFKRYEKKYPLTNEKYKAFVERIGSMLVKDEYHNCLVQNIYYDTPDYRLIRHSIEKPMYKEKLRLRGYNDISPEDKVYLEIKKKFDGIVYKRRDKMRVRDAMEFLSSPPEKAKTQIGRELAWFVNFYGNIQPAMYIGYRRLAYKLEYDESVRITFDYDIKWRTTDLDLLHEPYGRNLHENGEVIMEIKTNGALPIPFVRILDELGIYPASFSKYGTAYKTLLEEKTHGGYHG